MASRRSTRPRITFDDPALRPTLPVAVPSGRYRWVPKPDEQVTVPPPFSKAKRKAADKFETVDNLKRPLKTR